MQLGIFAKTFVRPTLGETLDAVVNHGFDCIQFNFSCVGLPTLPEQIDPAFAERIRRELEAHKITMAAVSGTFNLIHPDLQKRRDGLARLKVLIAASQQLGTSVITLCTGTRDPDDMWRRHPENDSPEAWRDLLASLREVLPMAQSNNITLAFEPEVSNAVDSALKGRQLLDELKSPHLKVVMDGANLFHVRELPRMKEILSGAFDLLGQDIVIAHAKDLNRYEEMGSAAAGKGLLDYNHYLGLLHSADFEGSLILHGLEENEVTGCVAFLRGKMKTKPIGSQLRIKASK